MKIGSLKSLCAAAALSAMTLPVSAQQGESAAGQTGGARSSNAGQNDEASGAGQSGAGQSGAAGRSGAGGAGRSGAAGQSGRTGGATGGQGQGRGQGQGQQGQLNDQGLVRWISAGNEAEIRVNELAQQQAESDEVKQFAQKMVQEHTQMGEKLRQAAAQGGHGQGASGRQGASGGSSTAQERTARRVTADDAEDAHAEDAHTKDAHEEAEDALEQSGQAGSRGQGGAMRGGNNPFVALHEEIKRQCAESTIQALREKKGHDFDHAFMHQQVVEHMAMLDTLKVTQQHASQNLKPALQEAQKHTQQHLEQAKQIVKQLDDQGQGQ